MYDMRAKAIENVIDRIDTHSGCEAVYRDVVDMKTILSCIMYGYVMEMGGLICRHCCSVGRQTGEMKDE